VKERANRVRKRLPLVRDLYKRKLVAAVDAADPQEIIRCSFVIGYIEAAIKQDHLPVEDIMPLLGKSFKPEMH